MTGLTATGVTWTWASAASRPAITSSRCDYVQPASVVPSNRTKCSVPVCYACDLPGHLLGFGWLSVGRASLIGIDIPGGVRWPCRTNW